MLTYASVMARPGPSTKIQRHNRCPTKRLRHKSWSSASGSSSISGTIYKSTLQACATRDYHPEHNQKTRFSATFFSFENDPVLIPQKSWDELLDLAFKAIKTDDLDFNEGWGVYVFLVVRHFYTQARVSEKRQELETNLNKKTKLSIGKTCKFLAPFQWC